MSEQPALILVTIGLLLAAVGVAWLLLQNLPWLGRLPGNIRWEGDHGGFFSNRHLLAAEPAAQRRLVGRPAVLALKHGAASKCYWGSKLRNPPIKT